jgi:flagellin-like hook-associated protein FlgL
MRIGASISGAERQLLNAMAQANAAAAINSLRLATNRKVNRPADDPAAFVHIASLESRLSHVNSTLSNVQSASNVVAQTQLSLDSIRTQLDAIRTALVADEDLTLTAEQRDEKQTEIDEALAEINRLATSSIEGRRRLDGSTNFRTSGRDVSEIRHLQVFHTGDTEIRGQVTTRAERAKLTYTGTAGEITAAATFTLIGPDGAVSFTVAQQDDLTDVSDTINQQSHKTGVTTTVSGNKLVFQTVEFGEDATLKVVVDSGSFAVTGGNGDGTAQGVDAVAVINDETLTGDGNRFRYNRNGLRFELEFEAYFTGRFATVTIDSGSANQFVLTTDGKPSLLGLPGLQAGQLRGLSGALDDLQSGGSLSGLSTNTSQAIRVVDEALGRLTRVEGQVDGFADQTIAASSALLTGMADNIEDTLSLINGINET